MNRRTFFRNGTLGALSLSLPALPGLSLLPENVGQWLHQITRATGLRRGRLPLDATGTLQPHLEAIEAKLEPRGYYRDSNDVYFSGAIPELLFYPLWLRHRAAGLTDLMLAVLVRQADGSWQRITTLTGFQVEALARAAAALAETGLPLAELLLPVRTTEGGFGSRHGRIQLVTRMQPGSVATSITVQNGRDVVFEATFASQHSLTVRTLNA